MATRKRGWDVFLSVSLLIEARATMYAGQLGESSIRLVANLAEEKQALAEGYREDAQIEQPQRASKTDAYLKNLLHPGYPNGGATGLLVKDYRSKNAEQEVWKFDSALEARIADDLKQAAIEEGAVDREARTIWRPHHERDLHADERRPRPPGPDGSGRRRQSYPRM